MALVRLNIRLENGEAGDLCRRAHLSTGDVAGIIGVTRSAAWYYLNGRRHPRGEVALAFARLLDRLERELGA